MFKKEAVLVLIILFGILILGCHADNGNTVFNYFKSTKEEIIKKLGNNYEIIPTGAEGSYDGYYYSNIGVNIVFESNGTVRFINCDNKIDFNGAKAGMNFVQIQKKLGKKEIEKTWFETEEGYKIEYTFGDLILKFFSFEKDGKDSSVTIYKKPLVSSPTQ